MPKETIVEEKYETDFTVDLTPTAGIFEGLSRSGYQRNEALREFSDNSFDEYFRAVKEGRKIARPMIRFIFDFIHGEISVEDNMGGIPKIRVEDVLKPGKLVGGEDQTVGYFALGLKAGGLSLGDFIMATWNEKEPLGTCIVLKKDDLVPNAQNVPAKRFADQYTLPDGRKQPLSKGMTRFVFQNIKSEHCFQHADVTDFINELGETYGILVNEKYPDVKMEVVSREARGDKIVDTAHEVVFKPLSKFKEEFIGGVFSPLPELDFIDTTELSKRELEDRLERCVTVVERDGKPYIMLEDDVSLRAVVGLAWQSQPTGHYGADVYMNNRMISKWDKISFGGGERRSHKEALFGKVHPSLARIRSMIFIEGPSKKTPSDFRKKALDRSNPLYFRLVRVMNKLYGAYKDVVFHWDTDLNAVLVQHKEIVQDIDKTLVSNAYLDAVRVQSTGDTSGEERKVEIYRHALKELIPAWRKDPKNDALVAFVTKKFSVAESDVADDAQPTKRPRRVPAARKQQVGKISVRKTGEVERLIEQAKALFKERLRVVAPTESQVVIESLKFYVKSSVKTVTTTVKPMVKTVPKPQKAHGGRPMKSKKK